MKKKVISIFLILCMAASAASCGKTENSAGTENTVNESTQSDTVVETETSGNGTTMSVVESSEASERESIEESLNLANNEEQEWTYSAGADAF